MSDAVRAALAMRAALAEYNEVLAAESLPRLAIGIGTEHGPVIAARSTARGSVSGLRPIR